MMPKIKMSGLTDLILLFYLVWALSSFASCEKAERYVYTSSTVSNIDTPITFESCALSYAVFTAGEGGRWP
jgi:hypothetical protein